MKKILLLMLATIAMVAACTMTASAAKPVKIIFDTDMGNDVDDVVALDMLYKYVDEGTITCSVSFRASARAEALSLSTR